LETLGDGGSELKSEYSLTQHLANNLIDMYINLPSKNHYRRPASYASKGYRTRRMAIDFAIPLITNVKVAKLFVEALVRRMPLNVSTVDAKTSHITHVFPGLVNIAAFVPNLAIPGSDDIVEASKAALSAGFTTSLIIPLGHGNEISDRATLDQARANISASSGYGNYAFGITASPTNAKALEEYLQADVKSLFIPFVPGHVSTQVSVVAGHFAS
jgi:carbamoyl-phosphate synthase/aspartate carbamoyltransferase